VTDEFLEIIDKKIQTYIEGKCENNDEFVTELIDFLK
jgi:hypothetical protein